MFTTNAPSKGSFGHSKALLMICNGEIDILRELIEQGIKERLFKKLDLECFKEIINALKIKESQANSSGVPDDLRDMQLSILETCLESLNVADQISPAPLASSSSSSGPRR